MIASLAAIAACLVLGIPANSNAQQWQIEITPIDAPSAILLEPSTGQVLFEQNADEPRTPASIAKLMLELIVVERIADGSLALDQPIRASAWASKMGGSQVYLAEGEVFPLDELMRAIAIASANDACVAVAEHIAGTEQGFVDIMNRRARELGLTNTRYVDVSGLEDGPADGNLTTARDIAHLAQHLVMYPHVLPWSSIEEAPFRDGEFILYNTNKLLGKFSGLDGLKTGFTEKAGFCLCATAERRGLRLISVVMGAETEKGRFDETARLLGSGFAQLQRVVVADAGSPMPEEVRVKGGYPPKVRAVSAAPLAIVLPRGSLPPAPQFVPMPGVKAPLAVGDTVGVFEVRLGGVPPVRVPAVAEREIKKANFFQQILGIFDS